jgi:hypothetical protein
MANVIPAAPISAFPVVIAGPTGPTGPAGTMTTLSIEVLNDVVQQLKTRVEALEARLHERE